MLSHLLREFAILNLDSKNLEGRARGAPFAFWTVSVAMKRTRGKSQPGSSARARCEAPDLVELRQQITSLVSAQALQMVETTIEQVQSGHYQALKYLFEMIGLYPATGPQEASQEDSLATTLLRHLGISEELTGVPRKQDFTREPVMPGGDAVK